MAKKSMKQKITEKVNKSKKITAKEYQALMKELEEQMGDHGLHCGEEIIKAAREIHGNKVEYAIPLYRSAIIILKKTSKEQKRGACTMILYHDPHWMGHPDITKDNLPQFKQVLQIWGQRSGPDLTLNEMILYPKTKEQEEKENKEFFERIEKAKKEREEKEKAEKKGGRCPDCGGHLKPRETICKKCMDRIASLW